MREHLASRAIPSRVSALLICFAVLVAFLTPLLLTEKAEAQEVPSTATTVSEPVPDPSPHEEQALTENEDSPPADTPPVPPDTDNGGEPSEEPPVDPGPAEPPPVDPPPAEEPPPEQPPVGPPAEEPPVDPAPSEPPPGDPGPDPPPPDTGPTPVDPAPTDPVPADPTPTEPAGETDPGQTAPPPAESAGPAATGPVGPADQPADTEAAPQYVAMSAEQPLPAGTGQDPGAPQPAYPSGTDPDPTVEPDQQEPASPRSGRDAISDLVDSSAAKDGVLVKVKEMAERAAIRVDEMIDTAAAGAGWISEIAGEVTDTVVNAVATAVAGAVSRLFDGPPAGDPRVPAEAPLVPPAAPAPGIPASSVGTSASASGSGNNQDDISLGELAVLASNEIAHARAGNLVPTPESLLGASSAYPTAVDRPG